MDSSKVVSGGIYLNASFSLWQILGFFAIVVIIVLIVRRRVRQRKK